MVHAGTSASTIGDAPFSEPGDAMAMREALRELRTARSRGRQYRNNHGTS